MSANSRFNLTDTHVSMGTLSYMAPEQRVDAKSADTRADIFSLGVILYELLAGEVPLGTFDPPSRRKAGHRPAAGRHRHRAASSRTRRTATHASPS